MFVTWGSRVLCWVFHINS